jgi:hypothetical protein
MRRRLLLVILFILLIYLSVNTCLNLNIGKELKIYIANNISQRLGMDISLGKLRFGLINNLTINDLKIFIPLDGKYLAGVTFSARFNKAIIRYRLWDLILRKFNSPRTIILTKGRLHWRDEIKGIEIKKEDVYGTIRFFDSSEYRIGLKSAQSYLHGKINPSKNTFDLALNFSEVVKLSNDFFLNLNGQLAKGVSQRPYFDLFINCGNKYLTAAFDAQGGLQKSWLKGSLSLPVSSIPGGKNFGSGEDRPDSRFTTWGEGLNWLILPFKGELSIDEAIVLLLDDRSKDPKLRLVAKFLKPDFELAIKANHISFRELDIVSELNLSGKLELTERGLVIREGRINSQNSILDYKPFGELSCLYQLNGNVLEILSLTLGRYFNLYGYILLEPPYPVDLNLAIMAESLDDLSPVICTDDNFFTAKNLKAEFKLVGPLGNPEVKGRFESRDGFLRELGDYESMNLNLNGNAKFLAISNSRIYKKEGSFIVDGKINFEKKNIFEDLEVKVENGALVWGGWEINREKGSDELQLGKDIGEDFRINFKTYINEETAGPHRLGDSQLELEYILSDKKSIKMQMKEDESFLGLEHKFKF